MLAPVMATAPKQKMTPEEFLLFERAASQRHMLWEGEVYAMAGGTAAHAALQAAVVGEVRAQLKGSRCGAYTSDLRVAIPQGNYVYPDASVVCGPEFGGGPSDTLLNPLVIFEVLSDELERFDRGDKFLGYSRIVSLRHYVLVSQHEKLIEVFSRESETANWVLRRAFVGDLLTLEPPGLTLNVDELYDGVELSPKAEPPQP